MTRIAACLVVLLATGCTRAQPIDPPPPDPCVVLRARIDGVHRRTRCVESTECELAPGIGHPRPAQEGAMGSPLDPARPCGSAVHHDDRAALDALLDEWRTIDCGPVSAVGSTSCTSWSHGAQPSCDEGECRMLM